MLPWYTGAGFGLRLFFLTAHIFCLNFDTNLINQRLS